MLWRSVKFWLRALLQRGRLERELDDELRFHLEREIEANLSRGMCEDEARREALKNFGGVLRTKEGCREVNGVSIFDAARQDLRYGVRMFAKHRGFTAVAILTLALGIGANSAIFSVVNAVLLRPLPYLDPAQLVHLHATFPEGGSGPASVPDFKDWREQSDAFTQIAGFVNSNFLLRGDEESERVTGLSVTSNFFDVLGVSPQLGRAFEEGEDQPGRGRVVVLSDRLWRRSFGGDRSIIGKSAWISGQDYAIIGVMPPEFQFPTRSAELWVPFTFTPALPDRNGHFFSALARLKPGVTVEQAQDQMSAIARRLGEQYPTKDGATGVRVITLQEEWVREIRPSLLVLLAAVGFVLLIACVNVANLLLARATARRREIAIRAALGAARGRLVRQFLTESLLLSVAGGALGLLLAVWATDVLQARVVSLFSWINGIPLDWRVVMFTLLVSVLTGVGFGMAPALQTGQPHVQDALKEGGSAGSSPQGSWLRSLLVMAEIASALVLLVGAGLLIKSFVRLQNVPLGFRADNVMTFRISLPRYKYGKPEAVALFYDQLMGRLASLPGVEAVGMSNHLPVQQSGNFNGNVEIEGRETAGRAAEAEFHPVSPGYFDALGIPLLSGRALGAQDREGAEHVTLVNQTFASRYFPGQSPLGRRVRAEVAGWATIVGVVGDVKHFGLANPASPEMFLPYAQAYAQMQNVGEAQSMSVAVRAAGDPTGLVPSIRREVHALDPVQPIYRVETMEAAVAESVSDRRLNVLLLGVFAAVALILAMTGIYSVMSYVVAQHTREIGIRMALGAQTRDVLKLVLGQGLTLAAAGVGIGVLGAVALTRLMSKLLFGVTATDPMTFVGVSALLLLVALTACYVPARRATKVDPLIALKYE